MNRTLNALNHLGNQRFVLSPFSEQLNLWLTSLKNVLLEFESSPGIVVDDLFAKERSQIVSNIEFELTKRKHREERSGENEKNLATSRAFLEQVNLDYGSATKAVKKRQESETKTLFVNIEEIKGDLERIAQIKTGFLRGVSKDTKAEREAEARRKLAVAEDELAAAVQRFNDEQEKVRVEYEARRQAVTEQIQEFEKEALSQEIDDSLDVRHAACDGLVNAVNSFHQRSKLSQL